MGWLALLGGGEFSFGETLDADRAWLALCGPGPVGFVPAASGSNDYPRHFASYLREAFQREVETLPIYRARDARRGRNAERIAQVAAVYLGGGVTDHLLEALAGSPAAEALAARLAAPGGMVVAIAAAAQAAGAWARSIAPGRTMPGLGWLPEVVVEPNFDPGHDRRLRRLMGQPGVRWGLGLPAGSAVMLEAAARGGGVAAGAGRGAGAGQAPGADDPGREPAPDVSGRGPAPGGPGGELRPGASGLKLASDAPGGEPVPGAPAEPAAAGGARNESVHVAGTVFRLRGPDDDLEVLASGAAW